MAMGQYTDLLFCNQYSRETYTISIYFLIFSKADLRMYIKLTTKTQAIPHITRLPSDQSLIMLLFPLKLWYEKYDKTKQVLRQERNIRFCTRPQLATVILPLASREYCVHQHETHVFWP